MWHAYMLKFDDVDGCWETAVLEKLKNTNT